ncbi:hypothetical protein Mal64_24940 [Pseudobythopirellula maris]|uniref:Uncharacterized protein n=1 Tax=Pseudobythopirellula maris TaxID=2527991 RepID=A0A5C5ZRZ6_9BACT|nr:hypothetical protein [Pseudobythopirellula maris]TWT89003.1 hypothetical protein Mal64_24940 [Pseudobythopirellula maris]
MNIYVMPRVASNAVSLTHRFLPKRRAAVAFFVLLAPALLLLSGCTKQVGYNDAADDGAAEESAPFDPASSEAPAEDDSPQGVEDPIAASEGLSASEAYADDPFDDPFAAEVPQGQADSFANESAAEDDDPFPYDATASTPEEPADEQGSDPFGSMLAENAGVDRAGADEAPARGSGTPSTPPGRYPASGQPLPWDSNTSDESAGSEMPDMTKQLFSKVQPDAGPAAPEADAPNAEAADEASSGESTFESLIADSIPEDTPDSPEPSPAEEKKEASPYGDFAAPDPGAMALSPPAYQPLRSPPTQPPSEYRPLQKPTPTPRSRPTAPMAPTTTPPATRANRAETSPMPWDAAPGPEAQPAPVAQTPPSTAKPAAAAPPFWDETLPPSKPDEPAIASDPVAAPRPEPTAADRYALRSKPAAPVEPPRPPIAVATDNTRQQAWLLGAKVSLARLMPYAGATPTELAEWDRDVDQLSERLGVEWTSPDAPEVDGAGAELLRLLGEGEGAGDTLLKRHGPDHAALLEISLKTNALLLLYEKHPKLAGPIARSVATAANRADLPASLWLDLLDTLDADPTEDEVFDAVYRLQQDIEEHLR